MTSTITSTTVAAPAMPRGLTGVVPPVCTPLTPDLEVDVTSLLRLVDFQLAGGVDGLFVLGSSSEVAFLPDRHRATVVDAVVRHVAGQVPVLVGVIDMTTLRVLDHAHRAVRAGCAGIVVTAPFYTRTHPAEVELHLRRIAEQCQTPVYAYDLPVSVHTRLDPQMLLRLAADGVLAGTRTTPATTPGCGICSPRARTPACRTSACSPARSSPWTTPCAWAPTGWCPVWATSTRTATRRSTGTPSPGSGASRPRSRSGCWG